MKVLKKNSFLIFRLRFGFRNSFQQFINDYGLVYVKRGSVLSHYIKNSIDVSLKVLTRLARCDDVKLLYGKVTKKDQ
jgi:hypothetical protein